MKIVLFILAILIPFLGISQTLKTYSGNFIDDSGINGAASYSYYEKDYNRIKNGPFKFSYLSNGVQRELKGQFKDGMRTGKWTNSISGYGVTAVISGEFKNGFPNGKWISLATQKNAIIQTSEANFTDGLLVGNYKFENKKTGESVTGLLNQNGFMSGEWSITDSERQNIRIYENNVYVQDVVRQKNTGEVLHREDYRLPIKNLSSKDIISDTTGYDLLNFYDPFGGYFLKAIWNNWDIETVGGVQPNPVRGMYFIKQKQKKYLSSYRQYLSERLSNYWNWNQLGLYTYIEIPQNNGAFLDTSMLIRQISDTSLFGKEYQRFNKMTETESYALYCKMSLTFIERLITDLEKNKGILKNGLNEYYLRDKDFDIAMESMKHIRGRLNSETIAFFNDNFSLGEKAIQRQQYNEAVKYFSEALKFKDDKNVENKIIECNIKIEEIEKQNEYKKCISDGDKYFSQYQFNESKHFYQKALNIFTNDKVAIEKINQISEYERSLDTLVKKGDDYTDDNKFDSAILNYKIVYYYHPKEVSNSLAWALILDKKFDEALNVLLYGISLTSKNDMNYPYLLLNIAHCYLLTDNYEKAIEIYFNNTDVLINKMPWGEAVVTDFNQFINLGINNGRYIEIAKTLKNRKLLKIK